uniref:Secreted protein n=1 Tax=Anguilla anguilla TaxID=7936 RepID=A0A0E9WEL6_ANGAN
MAFWIIFQFLVCSNISAQHFVNIRKNKTKTILIQNLWMQIYTVCTCYRHNIPYTSTHTTGYKLYSG